MAHVPFLKSAPRDLVYLHSNIHKGKNILGRLLTDPQMERSWLLIEKRYFGAPDFYKNLWSEIHYIFLKSHTPEPPRAKVRQRFLRIARNAKELAEAINDGPLDRVTYEFFPGDVAQFAFLNGNIAKANQRRGARRNIDKAILAAKRNWSEFGPEERDTIAHWAIESWPSMTDLLSEVARCAEMVAEAARTNKRIVERDTQDRQVNYFVRHLAKYFRKHLQGPMEGNSRQHRDSSVRKANQ